MPEMKVMMGGRGLFRQVAESKKNLRVEGGAGDTRVIWDSHKQDEVDSAKATFEELRGKGYLAYAVTRKGDKGTQLREFDPKAEKIILAPPMRGGSQ